MSEERAEYTVHPDVAIRLQVSEAHIKHLTSTIDGMTMVMGRHADTITAQRERIAELEATVRELEGALTFGRETIARLEQDNKRLRHLDAMPLDAMQRHFRFSMYAETVALEAEYTAQQFDADDAEIYHWLFPQDGDA